MKSNHIVFRKNKVGTNGGAVSAPDYSATLLVAKICTFEQFIFKFTFQFYLLVVKSKIKVT
jgi:predicted outer membrane repeat protein